MLLKDKVAIVVGGGQTPGETIGNGRATAIQFAREGAKVAVADKDFSAARETAAMIEAEGHMVFAIQADVRREPDIEAMVKQVIDQWHQVDILHNNVGVSIAGQDARIEDITPDSFNLLVEINLRGMVLTSKHVLPYMRSAGCGGNH
jgi:NAD(P)-dependent dehydrogenase (short-subunit alcohol dehydrogenase family)